MVKVKLPFSPFVEKSGIVFTSGQVYLNSQGTGLIGGDIEEQVDQVMRNLGVVLDQARCSFKDVVKSTVYLTDMSLYGRVSDAYIKHFEERPYPAREVVGVKDLPLGARVEISMIAIKE